MIKVLVFIGAFAIGGVVTKYIINRLGKSSLPSDIDIPIVRTSQYKGVYYDRTKERWKSGVTINKVRYNAGSFMTEEEAFYALEQLKAELNFEK